MRNLLLRGGLLALVALVLGMAPAGAHAALVGSDPEDGATLATAPRAVTLTFSENVGNGQLVATAPDGSTVDVSGARASDRTLTATLDDVDQRGTFTLAYRVLSADGHPVSGTIRYDVTSGRAVDQSAEQAAEPKSETFIHRHSGHLFWGILAAAVAIALLLFPLRRHDDADRA
ncbi:MAG: copper resistance CopC family protein [Aeromicrobium sp.]